MLVQQRLTGWPVAIATPEACPPLGLQVPASRWKGVFSWKPSFASGWQVLGTLNVAGGVTKGNMHIES
jgi:hypothetical protein